MISACVGGKRVQIRPCLFLELVVCEILVCQSFSVVLKGNESLVTFDNLVHWKL